MSSETTTCSGCDSTFSLQGYHSHLVQTWDPLCQAIFNKFKKVNDGYKQFMNTEEMAAGSDSAEIEAVPFEGDAFGTAEDCASDTFGQLENDYDDDIDMHNPGSDLDNPTPLSELSDDKDDDDEEMAHMVAELEWSWQPPWEGAPGQEVEEDHESSGNVELQFDPEEEDQNDGGYMRCNVNWFIIRNSYSVKPTVRVWYSDKYPNAQVGQPLSHEESCDCGYASAIGGGDNPWAPFNLKKDWEIVRWAKLQGVGSTAFSDLLSIDGACLT